MTKILYLIDGLAQGGAERQFTLLAKFLPALWQTRVLSLGDGPYHQVLVDQGTAVRILNRRSRFDLLPVFYLYQEILRYRPDIIHSWGWLSSALVAPICKLLGIRMIDGSIREGNPPDRYAWRARISFSLADKVVANSAIGIRACEVPANKAMVIYNALDPDRLMNCNLPAVPTFPGITVVMTGRIHISKDFRTFFEAARQLNELEPGNWKFIAIGAGSETEREQFCRMAYEIVPPEVLELPEPGLEVIPYLRRSDIGVLLNRKKFFEGFSNSIMEYMACSLPVICTSCGGNGELVTDGVTGFLVPIENVNALVEKLLFLKNHPDQRRRMGMESQQTVTSLCSIDRMISEYQKLYQGLMQKAPDK